MYIYVYISYIHTYRHSDNGFLNNGNGFLAKTGLISDSYATFSCEALKAAVFSVLLLHNIEWAHSGHTPGTSPLEPGSKRSGSSPSLKF